MEELARVLLAWFKVEKDGFGRQRDILESHLRNGAGTGNECANVTIGNHAEAVLSIDGFQTSFTLQASCLNPDYDVNRMA
jgi:hypothetical protein